MIKFKNLDDFENLSSDFSLFSLTSATSLASTLSMYFFKKLSNPDGLIIIGTKIMTSNIKIQNRPLLHVKIHTSAAGTGGAGGAGGAFRQHCILSIILSF